MKFKEGWNNRVLIVDDQEEIHQDFEEMLNPSLAKTPADDLAKAFDLDTDENFLPEFELLHAMGGKEAYEKVIEAIGTNNPIAVAYMDVRMPPGWDGVETTRKIRETDKDIEIVLMTAYSSKPLSEIVCNIDLLYKLLYVRKPFAREEIQQMTISLVEKWNVERELAETNEQLAHNEMILREQLEDALANVLSGFLPICAECKKIRDEDNQWSEIDAYIRNHTNTQFTYSICPDCAIRLFPRFTKAKPNLATQKSRGSQ